MNDKMNSKITFEICVSTNKVGSEVTRQIHIDHSDLEGVPEDKWEDFVWALMTCQNNQ